MFANINNPVIGNCNTMGILTKIPHNMFRFPQRRFTINNPWFVPCIFNLSEVIRQEILPFKMLLHTGKEFSPELKTQLSDRVKICLLYTSDAADEEDSVDLGGRR